MRIPLSWLKTIIPIPFSPSELERVLINTGIEVDSICSKPLSFQGIIVGEIQAVSPHENADQLQVAQVFDGKSTVQVVCGAPNCRQGIKTAFAPVGSELIDAQGKSWKIKKAKLRQVASAGMLCSAKELGVSEDHQGIIELNTELTPGTPLEDLYGDLILELSLTPNLGHCLSVLGIAREIAAFSNTPLSYPSLGTPLSFSRTESAQFTCTITDSNVCSNAHFVILDNIKIGPSLPWIQEYLTSCGLTPVNNVVDITNFVMLEMGQPLHAYDALKIQGKTLSIHPLSKDVPFTTLDGVTRSIHKGIICVHDEQGPIAIAGIMGGQQTAVSADTNTIILEAANFNASMIRMGTKLLQLRSESSHRFERKIDPQLGYKALQRAAHLLQKHYSARTVTSFETVTKKYKPKQITCRFARINSLLGINIPYDAILEILKRLDFTIHAYDREKVDVIVPSYRHDVNLEIDCVEEVARLYGFNKISDSPNRVHLSSIPHSPLYSFSKQVRQSLLGAGLHEFLTCDLISPEMNQLSHEEDLQDSDTIHVLHPSSVDQSILRTSLMPGLLSCIKHNFDHLHYDIGAFEIGKIHFKYKNSYKEQLMLGLVVTGQQLFPHFSTQSMPYDFFSLKGILESLITGLSIKNVVFSPSELTSFYPERQATIISDDMQLGVLGQIHPSKAAAMTLDKPIFFAQINLHNLLALQNTQAPMVPLPLFPSSSRDLTLTLKKTNTYQQLLTVIYSQPSSILEKVSLLDIYEDESIGVENKNLTLRFIYRSSKATLKQEIVNKEHERITKLLNNI